MQRAEKNYFSRNNDKNDLIYWHYLAQIEQIGAKRLQLLFNYFDSAIQIFKAKPSELSKTGLDSSIVNTIQEKKSSLNPEAEWQRLKNLNINFITWQDDLYPKILKEIYNPPFILYYKGNISLLNETCLAIVGTRKITGYGQQILPKIAEPLINHGITIVSGLALGIDALAHKTALENNGKTIAVLGSGLDNIYPAKNQCLAQKIIDQGLVISEYSPEAKPLKYHFPYRNRIISGLSLGTIVIEGTKDSGSLITAKYALDQNREIFAVPGNILASTSEGTNKLIKMGARPITSADDILESLNIAQIRQFNEAKKVIPENKEEKIILEILSTEPMHINEIIKKSGLNTQVINSTLSIMEIKGKVKNLGGNNYVIGG